MSTIYFNEWIYMTGPDPTGLLDFSTQKSTDAVDLANAYIAGGGVTTPPNSDTYLTYRITQKVIFLQTLLKSPLTDLAIITLIDTNLDISSETNPEIRERWYTIGLYLQYATVEPLAQTWVGEQGRNKYLHSIYTSLQEAGRTQLGIDWYNANVNFYAPTTKLMIQEILGI